jgi:hypothetical protein
LRSKLKTVKSKKSIGRRAAMFLYTASFVLLKIHSDLCSSKNNRFAVAVTRRLSHYARKLEQPGFQLQGYLPALKQTCVITARVKTIYHKARCTGFAIGCIR